MSITHALRFESDRTPEILLEVLVRSNVGLQAAQHDQMTTRGKGLYGRVSDIDKFSRNSLLKEFGIQTSVSVTFDEDSDGDEEEARKVMGDSTALLLKQEAGDAMFFYIFDTPILKRTNGTIKVIDEPEFEWLRTAMENAGLNYETQSEQNIRRLEG